MKTYFNKNYVAEAICHAQQVYPEESVGFILKDGYMKLENIADDKVKHFEIEPKWAI